MSNLKLYMTPGSCSTGIHILLEEAGLVFEAYTGETLFDGNGEAAMITQHVAHDGAPDPVRRLLDCTQTRELGTLIARCIRRTPSDRITIRQARQLLANLSLSPTNEHWPVRVAS